MSERPASAAAAAWRLILDGPHAGAANMARDEALRESCQRPGAAPILRLYAWAPPCLSLGYGQRIRLADRPACRARGWQIVRRPSGGGALLHGDELTYCLILPPGHPLQRGDIRASYRRLRRGLVAGLANLGIKADGAADADTAGAGANPPPEHEAICYLQPAVYEVCVGGRKLIGSAQLRRRHCLLQHGSLPLTADITAIADALVYADEAARAAAKWQLRRRAIALAGLLPKPPSWPEAASALADGFAAAFAVRWRRDSLTAEEERCARELAMTRYGRAAWNERR